MPVALLCLVRGVVQTRQQVYKSLASKVLLLILFLQLNISDIQQGALVCFTSEGTMLVTFQIAVLVKQCCCQVADVLTRHVHVGRKVLRGASEPLTVDDVSQNLPRIRVICNLDLR